MKNKFMTYTECLAVVARLNGIIGTAGNPYGQERIVAEDS